MKHSRWIYFLLSLMGAVGSLSILINALGSGTSAQGAEKSLLIERHANEPLELVDLKIREQSVKSKIKPKFRAGDDGLDKVSFANSEEWAKHVRIQLRNVSGKRIVGFQAYLYFKPSGADVYFSVSLKAAERLEQTSLDPGEDIEAKVDEDSWNRGLNRFLQYGGDINTAEVSLRIGIVAFEDGLEWHKGKTLRTDPENPDRRIPLETKRPPGLSSLSTFPDRAFQKIAFRHSYSAFERSWNKTFLPSLNPGPVQTETSRCVVDNGSYLAARCNGDPNAIFTASPYSL